PGPRVHEVRDRRRGGDEREPELALETLADDLHVEQPEEPAPEPEPECRGPRGLVREARVVEPQLLERVAEIREVVAFDRVETAENHRLRLAVAGQWVGGPCRVGDGLAGAGLADVLDARDEVADLARR